MLCGRTPRALYNVVRKTLSATRFSNAHLAVVAILPSHSIWRQFASNPDEVRPPKTTLASLIAKDLSHKQHHDQKEAPGEDEDLKKQREASWRTMKYTFVAFGVSFTLIGTYLIFEFGKPIVGENGQLLPDEYAGKPVWLQYILRTFREIDYYKRLIKEPSREKLLPDELKPPYYQPPYTLILELTDVLVHPDWTYKTGWRFKKRPGVDHFLETLSRAYEIVIYTAEQGMTVFPIIEALDPKNLISYKLVRDATHFVDGHHVKNLDKLNRDLNKVIVVDWNPDSVRFHPENVFHIPRWSGNDNDTTLIDLAAFLLTVAESEVDDVREVLKYYSEFPDSLGAFREKQRMLMEQQEAQKQKKPTSPLPSRNFLKGF